MQEKKIQVLTQANVISGYIAQYQDLSGETISFLLQQQQLSADTRVLMLDNDAKVTFDSNVQSSYVGKTLINTIVLDALSGTNQTEEIRNSEGELIVNAAVPITKDKTVVGAIYFQSSASDVSDYMGQMSVNLLILAVLASILIGVISFVMSGIMTEPIRNLTQNLKNLTEQDLDYKLEVSSGGEIGELMDSFNKMIDKLRLQETKRQEFVSNASHELKTPLSSIKLISDSLLQTPDAPREMVEEFLNDMNVEVDRLTRIINKLLTLTKMDNQQSVSRLEFSVMDINAIAANVFKALKPLAAQKGVNVTFNGEEGIYSLVEHDRLWEAIYNILDNSIKYTEQEGTVMMTVHQDENFAVIEVNDTGIGIASSELYKIFDRFYRVDKARSRETGGTGLGLSIALTAVELHGGNLQVESKEGVGSTFKITIPITLK
ncbi:MAG: HAMP domain-containing sensor histidine kinase [Clostridia bacterium]|nr:HAMP domain-containing sensor histidine kinase [Clostridia bacterium]